MSFLFFRRSMELPAAWLCGCSLQVIGAGTPILIVRLFIKLGYRRGYKTSPFSLLFNDHSRQIPLIVCDRIFTLAVKRYFIMQMRSGRFPGISDLADILTL